MLVPTPRQRPPGSGWASGQLGPLDRLSDAAESAPDCLLRRPHCGLCPALGGRERAVLGDELPKPQQTPRSGYRPGRTGGPPRRRRRRVGSHCGNLGPPRKSRSWVRQTIGSQSPSPWRSQPCHAFTEPGGYTRSQEDTKKIHFEYRRNRADTTGHERRRHCAGSGP